MSRHFSTRAPLVATLLLAAAAPLAHGAVIFSDGFGDGDRNNDGTPEVTATDATDIGAGWYNGAGTSAVTLLATDDTVAGGLGGNTLRLNNTSSNNRPIIAHFATQSLADGDKLTLTFDIRVVSNSVSTADRAFRFGLYHDHGTFTTGDKGSTDDTYFDDLGYLARVDLGADVSNGTAMDLTRDDTTADHNTSGSVIGGTATSLGSGSTSTNSANQITDNAKHTFTLSLTRSGAGIQLSLSQDSNAAINVTDATAPIGFDFNEVMFSARSSSAVDYRFDNVSVDYTPAAVAVPEPATMGLLALATPALLLRRRRAAK